MSKKIDLKAFWQDYAMKQVELLKEMIGNHLDDDLAKEIWLLTLQPTTKILVALGDADPDNKAQIAQIIKDHTSTNIVPFASEEFHTRVLARIKDDRLKGLVQVVSQIPFASAKIYTDDNPANDAQLRTYLESWAEDSGNQAVIMDDVLGPLLRGVFKKQPFIAGWVINTIKLQLANVNIDIDKDGK